MVAGVVFGDRLAVDERDRGFEDRGAGTPQRVRDLREAVGAFCANNRQTSSPSSARTFAHHFCAAWIRGHVDDDFAAQNSTSCGSSDTDVNELHAMPTGSSPSTAVTIATPVAK